MIGNHLNSNSIGVNYEFFRYDKYAPNMYFFSNIRATINLSKIEYAK